MGRFECLLPPRRASEGSDSAVPTFKLIDRAVASDGDIITGFS